MFRIFLSSLVLAILMLVTPAVQASQQETEKYQSTVLDRHTIKVSADAIRALSKLEPDWRKKLAFYIFERNPTDHIDGLISRNEIAAWSVDYRKLKVFLYKAGVQRDSPVMLPVFHIIGSIDAIARLESLKLFVMSYDPKWERGLHEKATAFRVDLVPK